MRIVAPAPASATPASVRHPAQALSPGQRQQLAREALAGQPLSQLARQHEVSRTFVAQQVNIAERALAAAFTPVAAADDHAVLFTLPVTPAWLRQLTLGLVLVCHSSYRGVVELCRDRFAYDVSLGHVHNVVHQAMERARVHNAQAGLAGIRHAALDELFQAGWPVLVGADVRSTYCFLLSREGHRDADTWGVRLLELTERGFHPDATLADFATGLRAGQAVAWPGVPCRGDVSHALQTATPLVGYLENRAYDAIATRSRLEARQARSTHRRGRKEASLASQLRYARVAEAQTLTPADDVAALIDWLRRDVPAVRGPAYASRCSLYDWIVAELRARAALCPHRIRPVRCLLENQRDALLAFARQLDQDLRALAEGRAAPAALVEAARQVLSLSPSHPERWQREQALWQRWGARYGAVQEAVTALLGQVVRASSVIENLNSRLRSYFFLRRHLGRDYLALLQFFLNHRRFLRSEHPERVDKSPAERLTGQSHPHWLELLGYTRFSRN